MEKEEKNKNQNDFKLHGISSDASREDKELFNKLKKIIYDKLIVGGHDYVPLPMEYRASSVAYCSRKTILNKDPQKYITQDELKLLPVLKLTNEGEIPSTFGTNVAGQVIHESIQEALKDHILSMEKEITFDGGKFTLMGHYDLLIEDTNGERLVIDIKSTNSRRQYLPNTNHLKQLMAYQGMLGGIRGALLYVHRNNWELSFVINEFDKEVFTQIIMKLSQMALYEEKDELPPAIPAVADECISEFTQCQFYNFCFKENT